jgi:biopolymer transport protein ExbB/TolQ
MRWCGSCNSGHFRATSGVYFPVRLLLVEHACARAAADVHQQLARGTALLATISATAPLIGLWLTRVQMIDSFQGCGGDKWTCYAAIVFALSEAQYPSAFGLATAIFAWCLRAHCRSVIAELDVEMRAATLTLLNELRRTAP